MDTKTRARPRSRIGVAWVDVLEDEAGRRERSLRDLSLSLAPSTPKLLYEYRRVGREPTLGMMFRVAKELGLSPTEQAMRVERRLQESER